MGRWVIGERATRASWTRGPSSNRWRAGPRPPSELRLMNNRPSFSPAVDTVTTAIDNSDHPAPSFHTSSLATFPPLLWFLGELQFGLRTVTFRANSRVKSGELTTKRTVGACQESGGGLTSEAPCRDPPSEGHRHPSCRPNKPDKGTFLKPGCS